MSEDPAIYGTPPGVGVVSDDPTPGWIIGGWGRRDAPGHPPAGWLTLYADGMLPTWTADPNRALRFARREDAQLFRLGFRDARKVVRYPAQRPRLGIDYVLVGAGVALAAFIAGIVIGLMLHG